jgi:hypothetical protein
MNSYLLNCCKQKKGSAKAKNKRSKAHIFKLAMSLAILEYQISLLGTNRM